MNYSNLRGTEGRARTCFYSYTTSCNYGKRNFFKLEFPYAHFATRGVTADLLFPTVWVAIRQVEVVGPKVIFITADGASPNIGCTKDQMTCFQYIRPLIAIQAKKKGHSFFSPIHLILSKQPEIAGHILGGIDLDS